MKILTMDSVEKRHKFLIEVYNEYQPGTRHAFNYSKSMRKEKASKLIDELRKRYGFENKVKVFDFGNATAEMVTGNRKYALD